MELVDEGKNHRLTRLDGFRFNLDSLFNNCVT